jgi:hypothetical protein
MAVFEVYFKDLTEKAQENFIKTIGEEMFENSNYDIFPIAEIEVDEEV